MAPVFKNLQKKTAIMRKVAVVLLLCTAYGVQAQQPTKIYRYLDSSGRTVYNAAVPPEYVKNGYTILNDAGQVLEVVPRALTEAELAAQADGRLAQEQTEAMMRKQLEADNMLLRLYRAPAEIERKRDERIRQIDGQITTITAAINKANQEVQRLTGIADNAKANGREASVETLASIEAQNKELARLQDQEARLRQDQETIKADASKDIQRLRELLNLPEEPAAE